MKDLHEQQFESLLKINHNKLRGKRQHIFKDCLLDPWNTACTDCCRWITFCSCIIACNNFHVFKSWHPKTVSKLKDYSRLFFSQKWGTINNDVITVNKMFRTIKRMACDCSFRGKLQSVSGNLVVPNACIWRTYMYMYDNCIRLCYQERAESGEGGRGGEQINLTLRR